MQNRGAEGFIALQMLGAVLFVFITISAFVVQRRGGSRHPTFFSFCFSWIMYCVSYAFLTFAGQQNEPTHGLCKVHSALVYAAPPLAGTSTVSLVTHVRRTSYLTTLHLLYFFQLLLNIQLALQKAAQKRRLLFVSPMLVITPWIVWIAIFIGDLLFGLRYPELVQLSSNRTYCILIKTSLPDLTSIWTILLSAILIVEEALIGVLLYRNREFLRSFNQSAVMTLRIVVFTIFGIAGVIVAFIYTVTQKVGIQFDFLLAVMPSAAAVIFGTQKDLLQIWVFWKRFEAPPRNLTNQSDILSTRFSSFSETGSRGTSHAA